MYSNREIPPELEAIALRKFDSLVDKGEIQYERPKTSIVWAQGFEVLERCFTADIHTDAVGPL